MLLSSLLLTLALATEPERGPEVPSLTVRIGLVPAELATIDLPLAPGVHAYRITSGVELDVTVHVVKDAEGELVASWALMPRARKVRGVDGEERVLLQSFVDHTSWPVPLWTTTPLSEGRSSETYMGGGDELEVGLKIVAGPRQRPAN